MLDVHYVRCSRGGGGLSTTGDFKPCEKAPVLRWQNIIHLQEAQRRKHLLQNNDISGICNPSTYLLILYTMRVLNLVK